jgi:hypothetical protein
VWKVWCKCEENNLLPVCIVVVVSLAAELQASRCQLGIFGALVCLLCAYVFSRLQNSSDVLILEGNILCGWGEGGGRDL